MATKEILISYFGQNDQSLSEVSEISRKAVSSYSLELSALHAKSTQLTYIKCPGDDAQ